MSLLVWKWDSRVGMRVSLFLALVFRQWFCYPYISLASTHTHVRAHKHTHLRPPLAGGMQVIKVRCLFVLVLPL